MLIHMVPVQFILVNGITIETIQAAIPLILKAVILSVRWVGRDRSRQFQNFIGREEDREVEIQFLQDRITVYLT